MRDLRSTAPHIPSFEVIGTGATEIRKVFSGDEVTRVVEGYMAGLNVAFAIAVISVGLAFADSIFCAVVNRDTWRGLFLAEKALEGDNEASEKKVVEIMV